MSTNKTQNYALHAWEAGDDFLRSEFNENFAAIDGVLGGKAEIVTGTYTGDGAVSRTISLGFTPKAVLVVTQNGIFNITGNYRYGGLALWGAPVLSMDQEVLAVVEGGFRVNQNGTCCTNKGDMVFHYLAVK